MMISPSAMEWDILLGSSVRLHSCHLYFNKSIRCKVILLLLSLVNSEVALCKQLSAALVLSSLDHNM